MSETRKADPGTPVIFTDPEGITRFGVTDGRQPGGFRVLELVYYEGNVEVTEEWLVHPTLLVFDPEFHEEEETWTQDATSGALAPAAGLAVLALPIIVAGIICGIYGALMVLWGDWHGLIGIPLFIGAFYLAGVLLREEGR